MLFEEPIGVAVEERFADDLVRGVVLTDALIGTFADAHDPSLQQNRCFLYHVIGGGTGDWDVPVGGMGALTDALADAARAAGAVLATGHEATAHRHGRRAPPRSPTAPPTAKAPSPPATSWSTPRPRHSPPSPATHRPPPPRAPSSRSTCSSSGCRGCATPPSTRARPSPAPSTSPRATGSWPPPTPRPPPAELPAAPPSEIYCHSLTDPTILGPDLAEQGYQTLTLFGLHTPARLFDRDNDAVREELLKSTLAQLDAHLAEPLADCLATDADGRPCIEAKTPARPGTGPAAARRPHLPPRTHLALRPGRHRPLGRGDRRTPTCCCAGRARCAGAG